MSLVKSKSLTSISKLKEIKTSSSAAITEQKKENYNIKIINSRVGENPYAKDVLTAHYISVYHTQLPSSSLLQLEQLSTTIKSVTQHTTKDPLTDSHTWIDPERLLVFFPPAQSWETESWRFVPSVFTIDLSSNKVTKISHIEHIPSSVYPFIAEAFNSLLPMFLVAGLIPVIPGEHLIEIPVVVKAKTFHMKPLSTYLGRWHHEGQKEQVTGVGLLYYDVSNHFQGHLEFRPKFISYCFTEKRYLFGIDDARVPLKNGSMIVFRNDEVVHRVGEILNLSGEGLTRSYVGFFICNNRTTNWKLECLGKCRDIRKTAILLARILQININLFPLTLLEKICILANWNGCVSEEEAEENLKRIKNIEEKARKDVKERGAEPWSAVDGGIMRFC